MGAQILIWTLLWPNGQSEKGESVLFNNFSFAKWVNILQNIVFRIDIEMDQNMKFASSLYGRFLIGWTLDNILLFFAQSMSLQIHNQIFFVVLFQDHCNLALFKLSFFEEIIMFFFNGQDLKTNKRLVGCLHYFSKAVSWHCYSFWALKILNALSQD